MRKFFAVSPTASGLSESRDFSFECEKAAEGIFSYESTQKISSTQEYARAQILPMSLWSIIAVDHLEIDAESKVLDTCCAPGMKLVYAGLRMKGVNSGKSITGVDISRERLNIAASLVKKYRVPGVRLIQGDSTSLESSPVREATLLEAQTVPSSACRCRMAQEGTSQSVQRVHYTSTGLRKFGHVHEERYNRILVDPECTQTSTVKYAEGARPREGKDYASEQKQILRRSIRMLEEGGIIVYSTCTFEPSENEAVISAVLQESPHMERVEIEEETLRRYGVSTQNRRSTDTYKLELGDSLFIAKLKYSKQS
ncbi:uncharacterized protein NEMAJ01_0558 [Nematocida major]|uniref:uncharacterized protein n=1 Tax=Nematocida major TaxID=1912982 RepID=UPI0020073777|nr:uncharacterized protein NEMAJ01_0558 [Nematocida major]KAH9385662.1 hypothetical protein NEMAJ01_0558 [Nematocida major]